MKHPVHFSLLDHASAWAASLWDQAAPRWASRTGQDLSYRTNAVNPVVFDLIADESGPGPCTLLDLGCGDGIMLDDDRMVPLIDKGSYLGVDTCPRLLERASNRHQHENCSFLRMNLTDPAFAGVIRQTGIDWRCIIAVFVIQEIADIATFFANLSRIMTADSFAVLVTVHPAFSGWLNDTGALSINAELTWQDGKEPLWQWAGGYPIVDEPHEPFPLPHFQRSFDDYRHLLADAGLHMDRLVEFPDTMRALSGLRNERISPFYEFPTNVYWPRIAEAPSSAALVVRKGGER